MPELICPICGEVLQKTQSSYQCANRHSYDLARSGYVNLMPPSGSGKRHGDDKLMVRARADFLSKGFYRPLSEAIADLCAQYTPFSVHAIDAGCGEGTYTLDIVNHLHAQQKTVDMIGIDISKHALAVAAKKVPHARFCVCSSSRLPVKDGSCNLLLNIFSPFLPQEFARVLAPGAALIRVYPLEKHLFELKSLIYDTPYENVVAPMEEDGFTIVHRQTVRYSICLTNSEDIMNLFQMTPYYYKTGVSDQQKAQSATQLTTTLEFGICVYQK